METRNSLKIGFIGGGVRSAVGYAHFSALSMDSAWSLKSGVFSRSEKNRVDSALQYGISDSHSYSSVEEFIEAEKDELDAVAVLTPTPTHEQYVEMCLKNGLAVICEKAVVTSSLEAERLLKVLRESNGFLSVVFNYSCFPMVRALRRVIKEGVLGEILHFVFEMPQESFVRVGADGKPFSVQDWRRSDGPLPTIYLDLGVHLHHLSLFLFGRNASRVWCSHSSMGHFDVIDQVVAVGDYDEGVTGVFQFNKTSLGNRNGLRLRIYGTKASAEWFQADPEVLRLSHANGAIEIIDRASPTAPNEVSHFERFKAGHPSGFVESLANLYLLTHDALTAHLAGHRDSSDFSLETALEGITFLEACVRSNQIGTWVEVDSTKS